MDRANLYFRTTESTPDRVYKPSAGAKTDIKNSTYMKSSPCGHASFDGQSLQDQNIIKIEVNIKKTSFIRRKLL
jgi:hypothetical protein